MGTVTPLLTSRKILNITYQTPQETLLGTPETLPTTEPATPQISYTVASGDLPTFNIPLFKKIWVAYLIGAGKAVTAATIYYRMKKNGASVKTGSSTVAADTFYTWNCHFFDVAVGDVLEIALWSSVADSNWDYKAYHVVVSRIIPDVKVRLLKNFVTGSLLPLPTLTLGNPAQATINNSLLFHNDQMTLSLAADGGYTVSYLYTADTYGFLKTFFEGDSATIHVSATYRPYYKTQKTLQTPSWRGVRID